jgi:hypothetical protein
MKPLGQQPSGRHGLPGPLREPGRGTGANEDGYHEAGHGSQARQVGLQSGSVVGVVDVSTIGGPGLTGPAATRPRYTFRRGTLRGPARSRPTFLAVPTVPRRT